MSSEGDNNVTIHGANYGAFNVGGTTSGPMSGANVQPADQVAGELVALLTELRAELAERNVAKREVIEDNLDDLTEDVRRTQDPELAGEVSAEVARSRWAKVKGLLTQVSEVAEPVARIGEQVTQLFGPG